MTEHETRIKIILIGSPENHTYRATCACGWRGLERWHQNHAEADARAHSTALPVRAAHSRHPVEQG